MSHGALIADILPFIGKQAIECFDRIDDIAKRYHCTALIRGSDSPRNIDAEQNRLNIYTDKDSKIVSFSIG
jgi:hypothetical protein